MREPRDPVLHLRVASLPFAALESFRDRQWVLALDRACDLEQRIAAEGQALEDDLYVQAGPAAAAMAGPVAVAVHASPRHALLKARRDVHNRRRRGLEQVAR